MRDEFPIYLHVKWPVTAECGCNGAVHVKLYEVMCRLVVGEMSASYNADFDATEIMAQGCGCVRSTPS